MLLNPKSSNYYFKFPKGFFSDNIIKKYEGYVKKQQIPFDDISQYINFTIQSISFPSLNIDNVEQTRNLGKKIVYKSGTPVQDLFSHEFTINFRMVDGFINYFIMLDTVLEFINFANPEVFKDNLPLRILDNEGNVVTSIIFKEVIFTSFSELELNYASNNPIFTTFSLGFRCNYIDIILESK